MSAGSWFHCSVEPIGRSAGRSVVAAAAYRSGERLHDERTATTHDYTRRSGVESAFIVAPAHAPAWAHDSAKLWNAAEAAERKSNARTAREVELALPASVSSEEREAIAREVAQHLADRYGVAVGVALHQPSKHGDERNYHAHILFTTRRMGAEGLGEKTRELDDIKTGKAEIRHIREISADIINRHLADSGSSERVSPDSYKTRGIEQTPTEHLGVEASAMERKGKKTDKGDKNRKTKEKNRRLEELKAESEKLDVAIEKERNQPESPTPWQDKINAEREQADSEPPPATPQAIDPAEQKTAQSAFNDPIAQTHTDQIKQTGEVKHKGLVLNWVEHAREVAREWAKDAWKGFVKLIKEERRNSPDLDR